MDVTIGAKITLLLREQDVNLLLNAVRQFKPGNEEERRNSEYLLDVLESLAMPE